MTTMTTQTSYTPAAIRSAFYAAAARIASSPSHYNHGAAYVRDPRNGQGGCVLANIGHFLGMPENTYADDVANAIGLTMRGPCDYSCDLFVFLNNSFGNRFDYNADPDNGWSLNHKVAAAGLRAFADARWPAVTAEPLDAAYLAFRAALLCAPLRLTDQREVVS